MKKQFKYPKGKIIFPYSLFFLVSIIGLLGLYFLTELYSRETRADWIMDAGLLLFSLSIAVPVTLWMLNKLKTVIEVDEEGINYKSLFKNLFIKWQEISSIEKIFSYERRYRPKKKELPESSLARMIFKIKYLYPDDPPRDLVIKTKNKKTITVLHSLKRNDSSEKGIEDFESEIKRYTNIEFSTTDNRVKINKKTWKTIIVALICIILLSSVLSMLLGKEGTATLLLLFGILIVWMLVVWLKILPDD